MWPNPQETADLVTFTEEILNGKVHFLWKQILEMISQKWSFFKYQETFTKLSLFIFSSSIIYYICTFYLPNTQIHQENDCKADLHPVTTIKNVGENS